MQKVVVIVGPTAVGKTDLSLKLAQQFDGEIISGDSMQVYQELNIGTAKVLPEEQLGIPHHLIDVKTIEERYSVADFVADAHQAIDQITAQNKLPIIVGGTGFYIDALLKGLQLGGDYQFDEQLRTELLNISHEQGPEALLARLRQNDPMAADQIDIHNPSRIIRAIEVVEKTDHSILEQTNNMPQLDAYVIALSTDRELLYQRINQRVDQMVTAGLVAEARWLYERGGEALPAGKGIGYREFNDYFAGNGDLLSSIDDIKKDSRHYAKRQLTWFRNKTAVNGWYDLVEHPEELQRLQNKLKEWLTQN